MAGIKEKRKTNVFVRVLSNIIIVIALLTILLTVFSFFGGNENKNGIFGVKMFIIQSDSMSERNSVVESDVYFDAGDVVFIKDVNVDALTEGDVIAFISMNTDSFGKTLVHKIKQVNYNSVGERIGFVTYGVNKGVNDSTPVQTDYIIGIYSGKIPKIGYFFNFVKKPLGLVICILLPFTSLIAVFCIKFGMRLAGGSSK